MYWRLAGLQKGPWPKQCEPFGIASERIGLFNRRQSDVPSYWWARIGVWAANPRYYPVGVDVMIKIVIAFLLLGPSYFWRRGLRSKNARSNKRKKCLGNIESSWQAPVHRIASSLPFSAAELLRRMNRSSQWHKSLQPLSLRTRRSRVWQSHNRTVDKKVY